MIFVYNLENELIAEIPKVKKFRLWAPFGAMTATFTVELFPEQANLPLDYGYRVDLYLPLGQKDGNLKFRGNISQLRTHSREIILGFQADREPEKDFSESVIGSYLSQTPTAILENIMNNLILSPLTYTSEFSCSSILDKVDFVSHPLFYSIDLLAKLADNWLWDINWQNQLRFRPHTTFPDHIIYYDAQHYDFKIWETDEYVCNAFDVFGGMIEEEGRCFYHFFALPESINRFGVRKDTVICRPISTYATFAYLQNAIEQQLPWPVNQKWLDLYQPDFSICPGDLIELRNYDLPELDEDNIFRVAKEEITYTEAGYQTRLYLARKYESGSRYLRYLDHDVGEDSTFYVERRIGSFRLDFSALDSQAHLE